LWEEGRYASPLNGENSEEGNGKSFYPEEKKARLQKPSPEEKKKKGKER